MSKDKPTKVRLDVLLVARGLFTSRESARRAIMAGLVRLNGMTADKPGTMVSPAAAVEVTGQEHPYVSRGGLKLERALQVFPVSLAGRVIVDIGASTGGFTDCALQHGAELVFAVDVGYGQLAWKLRNHPRVVVMERTNFRYAHAEDFNPRPDAAVMDVSFISIKLLLPKIREVLSAPRDVIALIKPQFEAGREAVGKGGIVRDPQVHVRVLEDVLSAAQAVGFTCHGLDHSPIAGGDGNIEFLAWLRTEPAPAPAVDGKRVCDVVRQAWLAVQGRDVEAEFT